jgi:hypothetical protein
MKITNNKMKEALNILIIGCKERNCEGCVLDDKCSQLDIESNFKNMSLMFISTKEEGSIK